MSMNLNTTFWKEYKIGNIFECSIANSVDIGSMNDGNIYAVGRNGENNGHQGYIDVEDSKITTGNCITLSMVGSYKYAFWQPLDFAASQNILVIRNKNLNMYTAMFICTIINMDSSIRYSYGRSIQKSIFIETPIKLPAKTTIEPNWKFMENYIKSLHYKPLTTKNKSGQIPKLNVQQWGEFRVGDLFPKTKSKHYSSIPDIEGDIPFVSSTAENNGISDYVNAIPIEGNCITVSTNGDCFDCFYHHNKIAVSVDTEILYNTHLNSHSAIFIASILKQEKIKYGYGRKPKNDKVYDTIIRLPQTPSGDPDWQFMEDYIKSLPYGDKLPA